MRDGGTEPQSLVSAQNIPGLNPKFLRSAYDVKVYPNEWRSPWYFSKSVV
jgi:hypothetical protein